MDKSLITAKEGAAGFLMVLLSIAITWFAGLLPSSAYERLVYERTALIDDRTIEASGHNEITVDSVSRQYSKSCSGYMAAKDVGTIYSTIVWREMDFKPMSLVLKKEDLTPTGIYREIVRYGNVYEESYSWKAKWRPYYTKNKLFTVLTHGTIQYGQFYIARLDSGENVVVLIDDWLIDTTKETVRLPVGYYDTTGKGLKEYAGSRKNLTVSYGISENLSDGFINTVSGWKLGKEYKVFYRTLLVVQILLFLLNLAFLDVFLGRIKAWFLRRFKEGTA